MAALTTASAQVTSKVVPSLQYSGNLAGQNVLPSLQFTGNLANTAVASTPDQCDLYYVSLTPFSAAASPTTVDLTALTDPLGGAWTTVARVRMVRFWITSNTAGYILTVGAGASNGWTNFMASAAFIARPSSPTYMAVYTFFAPDAIAWVVDGTHKTLKFDPGANTVTFNLELLGSTI